MMTKPESAGKPFDISKRDVWEAYRKVKGNQGAPGVDGQTLADFEKDLAGNLYKIWNRMSSGSYFPPPVRAVEIPKPHDGGTRLLGVPTVADRVAQTVVARHLEGKLEPIFHPDSYGYRPQRSALDAIGACRRRVLEIRLGDRSGHREVLRHRAMGSPRQSGGGAHRRRVGAAVCTAVACCAAAAARRDADCAAPWDPAGVGGVADAGEPVHALRVRHVADPHPPGSGVRTLRRRRRRAL